VGHEDNLFAAAERPYEEAYLSGQQHEHCPACDHEYDVGCPECGHPVWNRTTHPLLAKFLDDFVEYMRETEAANPGISYELVSRATLWASVPMASAWRWFKAGCPGAPPPPDEE
jgi:hypothetical protein